MISDARALGAGNTVIRWLQQKVHKEEFIESMFSNLGVSGTWRALRDAADQSWAFRIRIWTYAKVPWVLAPFFLLKRLRYRQ